MKGLPEDELALLSGSISGDRKASEAFVRRFSDLVYSSVHRTFIAKQIPYTQQDIEDLHNSVFLKLFEKRCRKLRQYRGKNGCSLASWIRMVATRIVLNHLRKRGMDSMVGQQRRLPLDEINPSEGEHASAWSMVERKEQVRLLEQGILKLAPRDRLFMKLYYEKGLSMEKVSSALNISLQNGYIVKHRAVQRLKKHVDALSGSRG